MADTAGGAARTAPTLPDELERLTNVIADASTAITEAIGAIKDSTKDLAERVGKLIDDKGPKKTSAIDKTIEKIEDDLGDVLGDAFADFGKALLDVATGDKGRFRKLDRTLRGRLRDAAEAVVGNLLKGFGKSIFDDIKAKLKKQAKEAGGFGNFALEVARDVARSVAEAVDAVMRGIGSGLKALASGVLAVVRGIGSGLAVLADGVSAVVSGIGQTLGSLIQGIAGAVSSLLGGVISAIGGALGGLFGGLFGGAPTPPPRAFAHGGRPPVGRAALVGEAGPELFLPDVPGTIVPNGAFA